MKAGQVDLDWHKGVRTVNYCDDGVLSLMADRVIQGQLVSFPTETVYGLGASALDSEAALNIFHAKNRPLSDPLICHVTDLKMAAPMINVDSSEYQVLEILANHFWPGPLTVVVKASSIVPNCIMGGTGFVGIRCPSNDVAQNLLRVSNVPIAAPSANKFGHISPTKAAHVYDEFCEDSDLDLIICDGGECQIGIESTVIKFESVLCSKSSTESSSSFSSGSFEIHSHTGNRPSHFPKAPQIKPSSPPTLPPDLCLPDLETKLSGEILKKHRSHGGSAIRISLLRRGSIGFGEIEQILNNHKDLRHIGLSFNLDPKVTVATEEYAESSPIIVNRISGYDKVDRPGRDSDELDSRHGPGMRLIHYAPVVDTYLTRWINQESRGKQDCNKGDMSKTYDCLSSNIINLPVVVETCDCKLKLSVGDGSHPNCNKNTILTSINNCVVIDCHGYFKNLSQDAFAYFSLAENAMECEGVETMHHELFQTLRKAEQMALSMNDCLNDSDKSTILTAGCTPVNSSKGPPFETSDTCESEAQNIAPNKQHHPTNEFKSSEFKDFRNIESGKAVILVADVFFDLVQRLDNFNKELEESLLAVHDRVYRACGGRRATIRFI